MKIVRYQNPNGYIEYGAESEKGNILKISGDIYGEFTVTDIIAQPKKILAPLIPPAIFCIGANYRYHIQECGGKIPEYPIVFMKGINAVQNPGDPIILPKICNSEEVDYEGELAVFIGKTCKNVSKNNALEYVLGYTCANDVSARDWQAKKGGGQWCRGKSFDTFVPLGPCLVTTDEITDPNSLNLKTVINGKVLQDWNTNDMIFDVPTLIEFLSNGTTLYPGTVILTGTPHGVGMALTPPRWLKEGDMITVEIEKIGLLTNPVINE